jgi:hypothetical protein
MSPVHTALRDTYPSLCGLTQRAVCWCAVLNCENMAGAAVAASVMSCISSRTCGHSHAVLCYAALSCAVTHCSTTAMQWQLLQSLAHDEAAMEAAFQAIWSCKEVGSGQGVWLAHITPCNSTGFGASAVGAGHAQCCIDHCRLEGQDLVSLAGAFMSL